MKREVELMKQIKYVEKTTSMKLDRIVNHDCIVFKRNGIFKGCPYVVLKAGTRALHSGVYDLNESELNSLIEERGGKMNKKDNTEIFVITYVGRYSEEVLFIGSCFSEIKTCLKENALWEVMQDQEDILKVSKETVNTFPMQDNILMVFSKGSKEYIV